MSNLQKAIETVSDMLDVVDSHGSCYVYKHNGGDARLRNVLDCLKAQQERENQKPMTNADRIRTMSDEELEQFINHFNICDIRTSEECKMSYCACCEVCVMDWLQQPAEEVNHGNP